MFKKDKWTPDEEQYLKDNWVNDDKAKQNEIAEKLGRVLVCGECKGIIPTGEDITLEDENLILCIECYDKLKVCDLCGSTFTEDGYCRSEECEQSEKEED